MSIQPRLATAAACLLASLSLFLAPPPARAEPANEIGRAEAKRLLRAGTAAYERRDYSSALADFQAAHAAFPSARIQYNLGQTLRELHRPVEATKAFEAFLKESDRITSQQRSEVTAALKQLEPEIARVTLLANVPDAEVEIDGVAQGKTPLADPVVVAPGRHDIALSCPGFAPLRETITVAGGEQRKTNLVLQPSRPVATAAPSVPPVAPIGMPTPAVPAAPSIAGQSAPLASAPPLSPAFVTTPARPTQPAPPGRSHARNLLGGTLLATSVAGAVAGAVLLSSSWARYHQAKDSGCARNCPTAAEDVEARALWSKLLFGVAAVSGAGAAAVFLAYPDSPGPRESASRPAGLVLVGQGTF